jgi:DNA-binding response OmpR family regulator
MTLKGAISMDNAHILVIEDNEMIADLMKYILLLEAEEKEQWTYKVSIAYDGIQGLEQIQQAHPDVILLDITMPRLDGYGVLRALRSAGDSTPVIMMSALHQDNLNYELLSECDAYISKPFQAELLCQHVQEQLSRKRAVTVAERREGVSVNL